MLPSNLQSWGFFAYLLEKPGTKFLSFGFSAPFWLFLVLYLASCLFVEVTARLLTTFLIHAILLCSLWKSKETNGGWGEERWKCTWCALQMRSKSCFWRKSETMSAPKVKDTPRSFSPQPVTSLSGSAHSRSHNNPVSGTSVGRAIFFIWSKFLRSGERPPCIHRIFSSIRAATGKQLKQSVKVFHKRMLKRRLHSS